MFNFATTELLVFPLYSFCQMFNVLPVSPTYALLQYWKVYSKLLPSCCVVVSWAWHWSR